MVPNTISYDYYIINDAQMMIIVAFVFAGICLSLNVFSAAWLMHLKIQRKKNGAKGGALNNNRVESHLFLIGAVMVAFQCLNGSFHVLNNAFTNNKTFLAFLLEQLPWISDLNNFNAPWLLFIINSKMRSLVLGRAHKITPYFIRLVSNPQKQDKKSTLLTAPPTLTRWTAMGRQSSAVDRGGS
ncbi:serpentine type 7TM GPCR chemoreceptor srv domain-containing protein [Ditylenchus destructor]|nr:serpentine type 7TM GPCR chemoreceptor srv domain-containing protein [Ditylenchus destructor]